MKKELDDILYLAGQQATLEELENMQAAVQQNISGRHEFSKQYQDKKQERITPWNHSEVVNIEETASDFINYVLTYENISLIKVGKNLLDNIIDSYELLSLDELDLNNESFVTFLDDFLNPNKYLFR